MAAGEVKFSAWCSDGMWWSVCDEAASDDSADSIFGD